MSLVNMYWVAYLKIKTRLADTRMQGRELMNSSRFDTRKKENNDMKDSFSNHFILWSI